MCFSRNPTNKVAAADKRADFSWIDFALDKPWRMRAVRSSAPPMKRPKGGGVHTRATAHSRAASGSCAGTCLAYRVHSDAKLRNWWSCCTHCTSLSPPSPSSSSWSLSPASTTSSTSTPSSSSELEELASPCRGRGRGGRGRRGFGPGPKVVVVVVVVVVVLVAVAVAV